VHLVGVYFARYRTELMTKWRSSLLLVLAIHIQVYAGVSALLLSLAAPLNMTFGTVSRTLRDFPGILGTFYKGCCRREISYVERGWNLEGPNDARKDQSHVLHPRNSYAVKKQCMRVLFHRASTSLGSAIFPGIFARTAPSDVVQFPCCSIG
jgi:hypothetical protein